MDGNSYRYLVLAQDVPAAEVNPEFYPSPTDKLFYLTTPSIDVVLNVLKKTDLSSSSPRACPRSPEKRKKQRLFCSSPSCLVKVLRRSQSVYYRLLLAVHRLPSGV